ncbi:peptidoglycan DD-metalloendopeptidase family protein [Actinoplanes xinjiangensis]|uniref:peptidoglycan DD-metalloendopeptidase family protein n=1 Tax=Actinoplanes xinjiangensis TaxID=512350 RepID=UPI003F4DACF9
MELRHAIVTVMAVLALAYVLNQSGQTALTGAGSTCTVPAAPGVGDWTAEQVTNAQIIVEVGRDRRIPPWGLVIAVATAIQESGLRNLPGGDRDSIGLFQQRPSQGWGTPTQLSDPAYQAGMFYAKLVTIDGWQRMPLTDAAQAVQISAYPQAYAQHTDTATRLVGYLAGTLHPPTGTSGALPCRAVSTMGWIQPVQAPIVSGFRTAERPGHDGVDLGAARHTLIVAAAAGTVSRVRCNATDIRTGTDWGCHRDGSPTLTRGCGWYVDITHPGNVMTRYCHMNSPPLVSVGEQVAVGQPLGEVGSTGHSSGPHLHFEVHLTADKISTGILDPIPWMAAHGAPLQQAGQHQKQQSASED